MRALLDTHTILWFLENDSQLSHEAKKVIEDSSNEIFVSIASLWEVTIKKSLGKLNLSRETNEIAMHLEKLSIDVLPIKVEHLYALKEIPFHHKDPFDRILISQAIFEKMALVSKDDNMKLYQADIIW